MKYLFYFFILALLFSCSQSKKELYSITDSFVESLQTEFESYGMLGGNEYIKITRDSQYQVMPVGRLINVKILNVVNDEVYKKLEGELKKHYQNDKRVNDVYINNVGTIMIDCRNK